MEVDAETRELRMSYPVVGKTPIPSARSVHLRVPRIIGCGEWIQVSSSVSSTGSVYKSKLRTGPRSP